MNSIKLFNFPFLKQNIKKSKGLLTVIILIVPILTSLMLLGYNSSMFDSYMNETDLAWINILGMYLIPFIISIILMGYIYKRNTVDFINSMPMSRKTLYFTNFITGALIILVIQLLTLITSILCTIAFTKLFLPTAMIFDCFVVMLVSYIFILSATMLAQTISGNALTQIVVTILILCLVPFTATVFMGSSVYNGRDFEISYAGGSTVIDEYLYSNYTMPFRLLSTTLFHNGSFYNEVSMIKMVVLSILYLVLGMYLFDKRKMENLGSSFLSMKAHYFVKALTLVPMVFIICATNPTKVAICIAVALMFVYYVIYDFVLSKKVKLKYTIGGFIVSIMALYCVYMGGEYISENVKLTTIPVTDISKLSISNCEAFGNSIFRYVDRNNQLNLYIDDFSLIEKICKNSYGTDEFYSNQSKMESFTNYQYVVMKMKLTNGKTIYAFAHLDKIVYDEVIASLKTKEEYKESFQTKDFCANINYIRLSEEDTAKVKSIVEENCYEFSNDRIIGDKKINAYIYSNHIMQRAEVNPAANEELFEILVRNSNNRIFETISKADFDKDIYVDTELYGLDKDEYYELQYEDNKSRISMMLNDKLLDYIKNHYSEKCDMTKPIIYIKLYPYTSLGECLYTNATEELRTIIKEGNEAFMADTETFELEQ